VPIVVNKSSGKRVNVSKEAPAVYEAMTALAGGREDDVVAGSSQPECAHVGDVPPLHDQDLGEAQGEVVVE